MKSGVHVRGADALRKRLHAVSRSMQPIGRAWANGTVDRARPIAPRRSGRGVRSIRVRAVTDRRSSVSSLWYMAVLDRGSRAHVIVPRRSKSLVFQASGRTVFSKKVHKPATRGLGFASKAGRAALRDAPMSEAVIGLWNGAA